jgi:hypothetical protein
MYIVTFYSFHRVGRTAALVNVGLELARRGRKVLLVDFDLEKPDLPSFPPLAKAVSHPGVVEYVSAYREKGVVPDIQDYLCSMGPSGAKGGQIWVMPAGKSDGSEYWNAYFGEGDWDPKGKGGPEYWQTLAGIDWQTLYDQEQGFLFFEKTREKWQELGVDYVLIDTHAGITPSLGITTRQLADAVVMMYNPHQEDQDRYGVEMRGGLDDVSWLIASEAEQTGRKPIEQLFVASQVLDADKEVLRPYNYEVEYKNEYGIFQCAAVIPFSHRLLLGKSVIEQEKQGLDPNLSFIERERQSLDPNPKRLSKDRLAREYRRLANEIIKANCGGDPDGACVILYDLLYQNPRKAVHREGYAQLEQIINGFQEKNADILAWAAHCLWRSKCRDRALVVLDEAVKLCPDAPELLWQRASYRRKVRDDRRAIEDLMHLLDVLDLQRQRPASVVSLGLPDEFTGEKEWPRSLSGRPNVLWLGLKGINRYLESTLRQLRELSAEKFEEAKKQPCITRLSQMDQDALFARLSGPETQRPKNPINLILEKKWKEVVDLIEPQINQREDRWWLDEALHLFMAYWALGDDKSLRICGEKATGRFVKIWQNPEDHLAGDCDIEDLSVVQMIALAFWKTGEREMPDEILNYIEWYAESPAEEGIFSFWRYERIPWELFKGDCIDIRHMIRGAKILPPVLEEEPPHF